MKARKILVILVLALGLMVCQAKVSEAGLMGTAFTYQGRLIDANSTADGLYDFQFKLFDDSNDPCSGNQLSSGVNKPDVDVIDGYFTVELDFGSSVFDGDAVWLEIGVRPGEMNEPNNMYTALTPRHEITPTPYAIYAKTAGGTFGGSGTANYIPKFTDSDTLGDSVIKELGTNIGIATSSPGNKLDVAGHINTSETYKMDGNTILSNEGTDNIFVGHDAGPNNTTGYGNTFIGQSAGSSNTEGFYDTFLGYEAGYSNSTGTQNTFLGKRAGRSNTEGYSNTFLGYAAGYWNITGYANTCIGQGAGYGSIGNRNVFIGYLAGTGERGSDKLYIACDRSPLIYGEFDTKKVGIDTNSPTEKFEVAGNAKITGDLKVDGSYYDSSSDAGTSGQILSSTGSGTDWIDVSGDITAVNAGTGLSGGGTSGDVTLDIDVPLSLSGSVVSPGAVIKGTNTGNGYAVHGTSSSGTGVHGSSSSSNGVYGTSNSGNGVYGYSLSHYGVFGLSSSSYAGYFSGDVHVTGTLSKGSGSFKIDHPLDPENKCLQHSFVESPDMMNVYNGNAILDEDGKASVQLPEYFEALNQEFRYQLTTIGGFAPVYIAEKISGNRFKIAGGKAGMEVSWQVTGIRRDRYAAAHRITVEEDKAAEERGYYLHPEAYGLPKEKSIEFAREAGLSGVRQVARKAGEL